MSGSSGAGPSSHTGRPPRRLAYWDPIDGGGYLLGDLWVPFPCPPALNGRDVAALNVLPDEGVWEVRFPGEGWRAMTALERATVDRLLDESPARCLAGWIRGIAA